MKKYIFSIAIFISVIATDQAMKWLAMHHRFTGIHLLALVCNPRISWSLPVSGFLFWFFWLVAISALIYLWQKQSSSILLLIAIAGAISNLIDRLAHGCVVDYINFGWFPVFNLADAAITLGIGSFAIRQYLRNKKPPRE